MTHITAATPLYGQLHPFRVIAIAATVLASTLLASGVYAQTLNSVSLSPTLASPQVAGTTIAWHANPSGGTNVVFRWYISSNGGGSYTMVRDWAPATNGTYDQFVWTPLDANSQYRISVWAKNAASSTSTYDVVNAADYVITTPPPVVGRITKFVTSGGSVGNSVITESAGNIGIGTTSPTYKLHVQGGQLNASGGLCINGDCKTSWSQVGGGGSGGWTQSGSNTSFSGGNVGVGTTAPGYRLDVQGGQLNASGGLCIAGDCKTSWSQVGGGGGGGGWTLSGANTLFSGGSVGIGTTTPTATLHTRADTFQMTLEDASSTKRWLFLTGDSPLEFGINEDSGGDPNRRLTIAAGGNVGIGTVAPAAKLHVAGNVVVDGNIGAKYQDVAEWVEALEPLAAGTVVIAADDRDNVVRSSAAAYDTAVAGVVSAQPGVLLGEAGDGKVAVAQSGRVRVKVDASFGAIRRGDLLVSSPRPGYAMRSEPVTVGGVSIHRPGTILGKALEPLESGTGEVLTLLTLQ